MRRRLGLTLLAALALAACGDDATKVESKADFIAAADKICEERDASAAKLTSVGSAAELGRLSGQLAEVYEKAIAEVQALSLPPGTARPGAQKFATATVALRRPADRMRAASRKLQSAADARDADALKAATQDLQLNVNALQALNVVADQAARDYGMRKCGSLLESRQVS